MMAVLGVVTIEGMKPWEGVLGRQGRRREDVGAEV